MQLFASRLISGSRAALAVLAVYALVMQAVLGTAAMRASLLAAGGEGIICRSDDGHRAAQAGKSGRGHGEVCICQGLCPQHGGAGILPVADAARRIAPVGFARELIPVAALLPATSAGRRVASARAPPETGLSLA